MKLKSLINNIFNKKNYKNIILILILLTIIFLLIGNYNLVYKEGLTLEEEKQDFFKRNSDAKKEYNKKENNKEHYKNEQIKRKDMHKPTPIIEGLNNCSSNFSNLGTGGNKANNMFNGQCNQLNTLKSKNKSLLENKTK